MRYILIILCLGFLWGVPVMAGDDSATYSRCFYSMDVDGNDSVDREEFLRAYPEAGKDVYAEADADGSGSLDHEEWESFKAAHGVVEAHSD